MDRSGSIALSRTELVSSRESLDQKPTRLCSVKKFKQILSLVTVEPVLFLYMLGTFTQHSIFQDLLYQKTCHQHFNASVCHHLNNISNKPALDVVQSETSHWILASTAALTVPSIFMANFLGSFSDLFDRKWPLIFPPIGMLLAVVVYIFMAVYEELPVWMIVISSFLSGIFGGFVSVISGVTTYISAVSTPESRTMRVALMEVGSFLGGFLGPFIGGGIYQATKSHAAVFFFILACYVMVIIYIIAFVPSVRSSTSRGLCSNDYRRLFSLHQIKASVVTVIRQRPDNRRRNLGILLVCALYTMTITVGEMDVAYLFSKDAQLNWSVNMYSYYSGLRFGIQALVLAIFSPIIKRFAVSDGIVAIVSLVSRMGGFIMHGFATTTTLMFIVPVVALFSTFSTPAIRSMLSKQVESYELGQLFAFVGTVENICVLFGSLIFNTIYPLTRNIFRGFTFELGAGLLLVPFGLLIYLERQIRRESRRAGPSAVSSIETVRVSVSSNGSNISRTTVTTEIIGEHDRHTHEA